MSKRKQPHEAQSDSESDRRKERELIEWAKQNGAQIENLSIETVNGLRGCTAANPIRSGSSIAFLPPNLILDEQKARESRVGKVLQRFQTFEFSKTDVYATPTLLLAAFLAHERFHSKTSFWKPYLESLPPTFNLPIEWDEYQVGLLEDTNLHYMVQDRQAMIKRAVELFNEAFRGESMPALTFDELRWGYGVIQSRAFPKNKSVAIVDECERQNEDVKLDEKQALSELCLYPVLDMINHKHNQKIEWNTIDPPGITFISPDKIKKGSVLWNNYGSKGNENLLSNYGFILPNNPQDYAKIALNIAPRDPLAPLRRSLIESLNIPLVHMLFSADDALDPRLIEATRVLVGNARELAVFQRENSVNASGIVGTGISRIDALALNTLQALIQDKVDRISRSMHWLDAVSPNESAIVRDRRSMVRVYREGQVDAFKRALECCTFKLKELLIVEESDDTGDAVTSGEETPLCRFLSLQNPAQSGEVVGAVAGLDDEEGVLDQDTILSLILMHEASLGAESAFHEFFAEGRPGQRSDEQVREIVGDLADEMESYYTSMVEPFLSKDAFFSKALETGIFTASRFVWASSLLETHGVSLSASALLSIGADFMTPQEGGDEVSEASIFGVYMS
ncbi:hypothetical protein BJ741DRAFT_621058 [Chytriomyces cf. hyalinus JEL632]|nr:hypothetical protein BJ741DRAFT_621058 [Chytriomyces cf. hyalinus JEL632]